MGCTAAPQPLGQFDLPLGWAKAAFSPFFIQRDAVGGFSLLSSSASIKAAGIHRVEFNLLQQIDHHGFRHWIIRPDRGGGPRRRWARVLHQVPGEEGSYSVLYPSRLHLAWQVHALVDWVSQRFPFLHYRGWSKSAIKGLELE